MCIVSSVSRVDNSVCAFAASRGHRAATVPCVDRLATLAVRTAACTFVYGGGGGGGEVLYLTIHVPFQPPPAQQSLYSGLLNYDVWQGIVGFMVNDLRIKREFPHIPTVSVMIQKSRKI